MKEEIKPFLTEEKCIDNNDRYQFFPHPVLKYMCCNIALGVNCTSTHSTTKSINNFYCTIIEFRFSLSE